MNGLIKSLYSQIAEKAIELIPTSWSKLILYAEIFPGAISETHYFIETNSRKVVQFGDIPNIYGIERSEFNYRSMGLTKLIRQMNKAFSESNQEKWTTMTFVLANDGEFNIDYGYVNLEEVDEKARREQWEKKYLNTEL